MSLTACSSIFSKKEIILEEDEEVKQKREEILKQIEKLPPEFKQRCLPIQNPNSQSLEDVLVMIRGLVKSHKDCSKRYDVLVNILENRELL